MIGPKGVRKERSLKRGVGEVGSKDPEVLGKKHAGLETSGLGAYWSMMDLEVLSYFHVVYSVPNEFNLELPNLNDQVNNPPLNQPRVYKEVFEVGIRFPIPPFIFALLRLYGVFLAL